MHVHLCVLGMMSLAGTSSSRAYIPSNGPNFFLYSSLIHCSLFDMLTSGLLMDCGFSFLGNGNCSGCRLILRIKSEMESTARSISAESFCCNCRLLMSPL